MSEIWSFSTFIWILNFSFCNFRSQSRTFWRNLKNLPGFLRKLKNEKIEDNFWEILRNISTRVHTICRYIKLKCFGVFVRDPSCSTFWENNFENKGMFDRRKKYWINEKRNLRDVSSARHGTEILVSEVAAFVRPGFSSNNFYPRLHFYDTRWVNSQGFFTFEVFERWKIKGIPKCSQKLPAQLSTIKCNTLKVRLPKR